jgi:CMP/dCMP kinase
VDGRRKRPIIVVDGPAGTGKSTVCSLFAERAGYCCLDTGALYRTVAWLARERSVSLDDEDRLALLCGAISVVVDEAAGRMRIFADGEEMDQRIRTDETGMAASRVSGLPGVRRALLPLQRAAGAAGGIIAEGRDMGTVVFPDADIKIFLDADPSERAKRRYRELTERGEKADYDEVLKDMSFRDEQDMTRSVAPLRPADDAIVLDTTRMNREEVVQSVMEIVRSKRAVSHESSVL